MLPYVHRGADQAGFFVQACTMGGDLGLLRPAPGNRPPAEGPFLCMVPVLDPWRMIGALAQRNQVRHYAAEIEPAILEAVRAGRAAVVFDLCNEGPAFHAESFAELHRWIDAHALPAANIVWLQQNRAIERSWRARFGAERPPIQFAFYDFFLKVTAWLFSPRARAPVLGADPTPYLARLSDPAEKDRLLLCLNATPRPHRVLAIAGLIHHGLFNRALVSFPGIGQAKDAGGATRERLAALLDANPPLAPLRPAVEQALALRDLRVDGFAQTGNALFDRIDTAPYLRSFFSLVTETEATAGEVDRITEKAMKAACLGHPTLIVGNPHASRFLAELGLQDMPGVIDRSYEAEADPARRFVRLFAEVARQAEAIGRDPARWLAGVRAAAEANVRLATSGELLDNYVALYDRPVVAQLRAGLLGG